MISLSCFSVARSDTEDPPTTELQSSHDHNFPKEDLSDSLASLEARARKKDADLALLSDRNRSQSSHAYEPINITTDADGEVCIDVRQSERNGGAAESNTEERGTERGSRVA